jgi:hypothetical protein
MTPNGAVAFALVLVLVAFFTDLQGLALPYAALLAFAVAEIGAKSVNALRRAALVMAPLAAFMLVVWVGIVGRAPSEIATGMPGSRTAALVYASTVAARLFLIVALVQFVALRFEDETPLAFVRALRAPLAFKRLAILTLSLVETLRHAVDRAHTALIAGGIITRGLSMRNVGNGWILVQTVWLTTITTVTARLRDKWPIENTLALLDPALLGVGQTVTPRDVVWILLAGAAAVGGLLVSSNVA